MKKRLNIGRLELFCLLEEDNYYNDEPLFFTFKAIVKNSPKDIHGTGSSFNKDSAKIRALGEAIERYALIPKKEKNIFYRKYNELPSNKADLSHFTLLSDNAKLTRDYKDKRMGWIKGKKIEINKNLSELEEYYIPAQLIFVPYHYNKMEPLIYQPISTGAALQKTLEKALVSGVLEIFERDSFVVSFYTHTGKYRLDLSAVKDNNLVEALRELDRNFLEYYFIDVSNFKDVNVILCIVFDKTSGQPKIASGMGADFNLKMAVMKSIDEALQLRPWLRDAFSDGKVRNVPKDQIKEYFDRVGYWNLGLSTKKIKERIKFYLDLPLKGVSRQEFNSNSTMTSVEKLERLYAISKSENFEIFYADITPDFLKNNFYAIKVIIPQAQPFFLNEKFAYLSKKRFGAKGKIFENQPHFFL